MKQINKIDLNSYRDRVYQNAVNHGWHEEKKSDEHWMCLVISELMEAVEADRVSNYADIEAFEKGEMRGLDFRENFERYIKDTVQDELADACIRLFDMAGVHGLDLQYNNYEMSCTLDFSSRTFTESMCDMIDEFFVIKFCTRSNLNEIFAFCDSRNIDIFWFIDQKMKYNESRPFKHGGKKY